MSIKIELRDENILKIGNDTGVTFCRLMAREQAPCEGVVAITINRPDPVLNLVVHANFEEQDADEKIKAILDFYKQRYVAWTWVVGPATRPVNLPQHLERHGFAYLEEYPSFYLDLTKPITARRLDKFDIREAGPEDQLREWIKPISEGFPSSDRGEGFREVNADLPHGKGTSLRHFMIYLRNQVVAAGTLYVGSEAVMIHNVATKTSVRKQGFGTALTLYAMLEAKRLGFKHCFLDSTTSGFNLYRHLGYKVFAANQVYALKSLIRKKS